MPDYVLKINNFEAKDSDGYSIKDINLDVEYGKIYALLGDRGSGKKTFAYSLAGFYKEINGKVVFKDQNISSNSSISQINGLEFLLQKNILFNKLSVSENLFFNEYPKIKNSPVIDWIRVMAKAKKILKELDINLNINKKVGQLSFENKKILAASKIYAKNPDLVIMYEPTENLSNKYTQKIYKIVKEIKKKGGSVLYFTNKWEEILEIADEILVLSNGNLIGELSAVEAKKNPRKLLNMLSGYNEFNENDNEDKNTGNKNIFDTIFKATEYLTSDYELNDVLNMLSDSVLYDMNAVGCYIYLIDDSTNSIINIVKSKSKQSIKMMLKNEIINNILLRGDIFYLNIKNKKFKSSFEEYNGIKTTICIPVFIRSTNCIIQVSYNSLYIYSGKDLKYLSTLAKQVAIAVEDTRLMGRSRLLKESHHRIKNNLQNVISLISLQSDFIEKNQKKSYKELIEATISRIKSIAAVHDILSCKQSNRSIINIKTLVNRITQFYSHYKDIKIEKDIEDIFISYNKATTIGLIINELLSNCFKHAFTDKMDGKIVIICKKTETTIELSIEDNGKGLPDKFDIKNKKNLGVTIVFSTIKNELNGDIQIINNNGTKVEISIPNNSILLQSTNQ